MKDQRHLFDIPESIKYLNCAYMAPLMHSVVDKGIAGVQLKQRPWEIGKDEFFLLPEAVKREFSKLINAPSFEQVSILPSVSYGIATVAKNVHLERGEEVLVAKEQFPSNYYSWQSKCANTGAKLISIGPTKGKDRQSSWNENILNAIHSKTKLVALPHVHWADGTLFDLKAIREATSAVGAKLVIDGTQSVGALPFDQELLQVDALVCAGYKWLLGPYSIGLAYYSPTFNAGMPLEENWIAKKDSSDFAGLVNYKDQYAPGAERFDVGEKSNFALLPMLLESLKVLNKWQPNNVIAYCEEITKGSMVRLKEHGMMAMDSKISPHLFGIKLSEQTSLEHLATELVKEQFYVSIRGQSVRVSVNVFNRASEMEALTDLIIQLQK